VADAIADTVVETYIAKNPWARTSIEILIKGNNVIIAGEVTVNKDIEVTQKELEAAVKNTVKKIGYNGNKFSETQTLNASNLIFSWYLTSQSEEIAMGMNKEDIGANDQGIMLGYAEHSEIYEKANGRAITVALAQDLAFALNTEALNKNTPFGVDIKTQVILDFISEDNFKLSGYKAAPVVDTIVVAIPTISGCEREEFEVLINEVINNLFEPIDNLIYNRNKVKVFINSTGKYTNHGPLYDVGVTGRKLGYKHGQGGKARLGGGNDTGKTVTGATDRIALYASRYIAKNIVAAGLAKTAEVQLSYAIGVAEPLSINLNLVGTSLSREEISSLEATIAKEFPVTPSKIIKEFRLTELVIEEPHYFSELAKWGPFSNPESPWEQTDKADKLRKYFKK
jgi:S-adenosylmethionine synthetase